MLNWELIPCYNIDTMAEKKKSPRGSEFWQILFPTLLGAAMILAFGIWFGLTGSTGSLSRYGEVSTVLLAIPVYIAGLIFALVLVGLIYLITRLIRGLPEITGRILQFLDKVRTGASRGSQSVARLVIEPLSIMAIIQRKRESQDPEIKL